MRSDPPNATGTARPRQRYAASYLFSAMAAGLALLVILVYVPGYSSSIHFDDKHNLQGLEQVKDIRSALAFVTSGDAGPTGRPLALLSFLLQRDAWPLKSHRLIATNVWIHLLNAILVGLLAWLLIRYRTTPSESQLSHWLALAVAALWAFLPLLASSSLFIVQRMTLLATLLVLIGLVLHTLGRLHVLRGPRLGLSLMTAGASLGLGLGVLAKENAAVYPLLLLAIDRTLLSGFPVTRPYRIWRIIFGFLPAALVILYLLDRLISGGGFGHRHFDLGERFFTQGIVLFDYLRVMLFPNVQELGPFHDHYPIYGGFSRTVAIFATLSWIVLGIAAVVYGRRWPVLAFGILWFLAAHLIESTWLPLELYFEHRNYLPAVGLVLALVLLLSKPVGRAATIISTGLALYVALLVIVLFQSTSLWGNPRVAAEVWWAENPASVRAASYLASIKIEEGLPANAMMLLDKASENDTTQLFLPLVAMQIECTIGEGSKTQARYLSILERAPHARYVNRQPSNELEALGTILDSIANGQCDYLSYSEIAGLAEAFLSSHATGSGRRLLHNYYVLFARAAQLDGDLESMAEHLVTAVEHGQHIETARNAAEAAVHLGRGDLVGRIYTVLVANGKPRNPLKRDAWQNAVDDVAKLRDTHFR